MTTHATENLMDRGAWRSILNFGTEGGSRLNLPEKLKCGILSFGSSQEKLKKLFILSIAFFTMSRADSIGF